MEFSTAAVRSCSKEVHANVSIADRKNCIAFRKNWNKKKKLCQNSIIGYSCCCLGYVQCRHSWLFRQLYVPVMNTENRGKQPSHLHSPGYDLLYALTVCVYIPPANFGVKSLWRFHQDWVGVWSQKGKYNSPSSVHKWEALQGTCE